MCSRTCRLCLGAVAVSLIWQCASPAWGGTWNEPVSGGAVILAFAERYNGRTHRGIDLAAPAGAEVRAPSGGTVVFAGTVPADGGGTCHAVTVELVDGLRVSMLPLESVLVAAGDRVSSGDAVGHIAQAGDDSSAAPHLHLGLRDGEAYLDPAGLLPAPTSVTPTVDAEVPCTVSSPPTPGIHGVSSISVSPGATGVASSPVAATASSSAAPAVCGDSTVAYSAGAAAISGSQRTTQDVSRTWSIPVSAELPEASHLRPDVTTEANGGLVLSEVVPDVSTTVAALVTCVCAVALGLTASRRAAAARVS